MCLCLHDQFRTSDSEGFPRGVIGDDPRTIPLSILEHFTNPLDMDGVGVERMLEDMKKDLPLLRDGTSSVLEMGALPLRLGLTPPRSCVCLSLSRVVTPASDDDDRQQPIRFNADETSDDPNRGFERPSPLEEKTRLDQYRALVRFAFYHLPTSALSASAPSYDTFAAAPESENRGPGAHPDAAAVAVVHADSPN